MATIDYKEKYEQALEKVRVMLGTGDYTRESLEYVFPELKESEDEKTKRILHSISSKMSFHLRDIFTEEEFQCFDTWSNAWLEKQAEQKPNPVLDIEIPFGAKDSELQEASYHIPEGFHAEIESNRVVIKRGEQKPVIEIKSAEESLGIDSDTYNKIVDECIFGEQKPDDKVEPKFKQGDIIKEKETGNLFYVNSIEDFGYTLHYKNCIAKGCTMAFKYEDNYELVEQKPAEWNEEDESHIRYLIECLENCKKGVALTMTTSTAQEYINWLKSLRPNHWKPSEEQMEYLAKAILTLGNEGDCKTASILNELRTNLKKLKD